MKLIEINIYTLKMQLHFDLIFVTLMASAEINFEL